MTQGQVAYVCAVVAVTIAMLIGSLFLPVTGFFVLTLVVFTMISLFRKEITPKGSLPESPLKILEDSGLWQIVATLYTAMIVLVVAYHLGVERLSVFDRINFPIFILLILGGVAGPIAVHIGRTYRMLGEDADE